MEGAGAERVNEVMNLTLSLNRGNAWVGAATHSYSLKYHVQEKKNLGRTDTHDIGWLGISYSDTFQFGVRAPPSIFLPHLAAHSFALYLPLVVSSLSAALLCLPHLALPHFFCLPLGL